MTTPTDADRLAGLLAWADDVEVEDLQVEDTSDLAAVGAAQAAAQAQLQALDLAVAAAREAGRSWTEIGQRVGISRQAARQRWGKADQAGDAKSAKGRVVASPRPGASRAHRVDDGPSKTRRAGATAVSHLPQTVAALAPAASTHRPTR